MQLPLVTYIVGGDIKANVISMNQKQINVLYYLLQSTLKKIDANSITLRVQYIFMCIHNQRHNYKTATYQNANLHIYVSLIKHIIFLSIQII